MECLWATQGEMFAQGLLKMESRQTRHGGGATGKGILSTPGRKKSCPSWPPCSLGAHLPLGINISASLQR